MKFKFIDLFCGIGGFHQACINLGGECILACDIDKKAITVYEKNYKIKVHQDITTIKENDIPDFDVLCAGFPCQPFSKCGNRGGFSDTRGTLFFDIERILVAKKPKFIILENVVNILHHDDGNTFAVIKENLSKIGYRLTETPMVVSPHELNTPQIRKRVLIVGKYEPEDNAPIDVKIPRTKLSLTFSDVKDTNINKNLYPIKKDITDSIDAWDEFYQHFKTHPEKGTRNFFLECLFNHARLNTRAVLYVKKNNEYYSLNKGFIDDWVKKYDMLNKQITHQHFYLMGEPKVSTLWDCVIQVRANGIVFTQTDIIPTLTKSGTPPIYGPEKRYLTPNEYRKLQDFPKTFICDINDKCAYNQFGNAVNVKVIQEALKSLFKA